MRLAIALFGISSGASMCAQPSLELTGVVLDHETKKPIEGVYVLAAYHETVASAAVMKQWCVRTRGMKTGADGRFHFPVEKRDGQSPAGLDAIKTGYYFQLREGPDERTWKRQEAGAFSNHIIYLSKQDVSNPKYRFGSEDPFCSHARTTADAAAGIEFLKIWLQEMSRLGLPVRNIGAVRDMIERLEGIDHVPPGAVNPKVTR